LDELSLEPGARIGAFEVERMLGSGTMGVVVAARHVERGEPVAIKVMHAGFTRDPQFRERFVREGKTARVLKSEHIVRVIDVGVLPTGQPYIVMERLSGIDLDALLEARGPLPIRFVVDAVLQACSALSEAHGVGIVHRDLKPSNFFLVDGPGGAQTIKILDFGIAKTEMFRGPELTVATVTLGSPPYMSPEQIKSSKDVDQRADIWSLGVTIFELLTGELPFYGETLGEIAGAILRDPPRPIEGFKSDVQPALAAVIARCLTKERDQRYGTVEELAAELETIAKSLPSVGPLEPPESAARPQSSRRFRRGVDTTLVGTAKLARTRQDLVRATKSELRKMAGPLLVGVLAGLGIAVLVALLVGVLLIARRC
jgi:serine/threonine-protein kinase